MIYYGQTLNHSFELPLLQRLQACIRWLKGGGVSQTQEKEILKRIVLHIRAIFGHEETLKNTPNLARNLSTCRTALFWHRSLLGYLVETMKAWNVASKYKKPTGNWSEEEFLSVVGSFLSGFSCFVRNVREPPGNQTMPYFTWGKQIFTAIWDLPTFNM